MLFANLFYSFCFVFGILMLSMEDVDFLYHSLNDCVQLDSNDDVFLLSKYALIKRL